MMLVAFAALFTVVSCVPTTMNAVVASSYVGTNFDKLKLETIATPQPGPSEVLIAVNGSSVNPVDWKIIEANIGFPLKFPTTLGFDVAGTVVAVGAGVQRLQVGDAVWTDLGFSMHAYAEYVVAQESIVALAPKSLSLAEAAVLPLVSLTGFEALVTYGKAPWEKSANKTVLITAGQGGTGLVGIQLAKAWGAQTVITSASPENVDLMYSLGADIVVDYTKASIWDAVPDDSVDIVYENFGAKGTADSGLAKVRKGGLFVYIAGEKPSKTKAGVAIQFFLTDSSHYEHLDAIKAVVDTGGLKPLIQATYPLSQVPAAFAASSAGHTIGKIAISIGIDTTLQAAVVPLAARYAASDYTCPDSAAFIHASCKQAATLQASCANVAAEIQARVGGQHSAWHDPHNNGTYTVISASDSVIQLQRVTGNKKYTDKISIALSGSGDTCTLRGCSASQVTSIADMSTNYCNVRVLYCGTGDGCKFAKTDLTSSVTEAKPSLGASANWKDCLVN